MHPAIAAAIERNMPESAWRLEIERKEAPPLREGGPPSYYFPSHQDCLLAEAIAGALTTMGPLDQPQPPHVGLSDLTMRFLAVQHDPEHPMEEPAAVAVAHPLVRMVTGIDAVFELDVHLWDTLQRNGKRSALVATVDFGLSLLGCTEDGAPKKRRRPTVDPWGIVGRWGRPMLADTMQLLNEADEAQRIGLGLE